MRALQSLPDPEVIRRTAEEVIQRPAYDMRSVPDHGISVLVWILHFLSWLVKPFKWLFDAMEGMPDLLRWAIVIGLFVILVGLIAHIIHSVVVAIREPQRGRNFDAASLNKALDPASLERRARAAVQSGDYISAIRLLFRACLVRLERFEKRKFRPGMTNREHLRRYRNTPIFDPMTAFVATIDTKWYGGQQCGKEDYDMCSDAHATIEQFTKDGIHANRA